MGVRNCAELGENAQKIMRRLMANQDLLKLLYYTDKDPLSHEDLTKEQIQKEVFEKLIKITPRVGPKETANAVVAIRIVSGQANPENNQFRNVSIGIEVFTPMDQWVMKGVQLRPFAILGEIQKSLSNKTINGLGKMQGGSFTLNFLIEEMSDYEMNFDIISYD